MVDVLTVFFFVYMDVVFDSVYLAMSVACSPRS